MRPFVFSRAFCYLIKLLELKLASRQPLFEARASALTLLLLLSSPPPTHTRTLSPPKPKPWFSPCTVWSCRAEPHCCPSLFCLFVQTPTSLPQVSPLHAPLFHLRNTPACLCSLTTTWSPNLDPKKHDFLYFFCTDCLVCVFSLYASGQGVQTSCDTDTERQSERETGGLKWRQKAAWHRIKTIGTMCHPAASRQTKRRCHAGPVASPNWRDTKKALSYSERAGTKRHAVNVWQRAGPMRPAARWRPETRQAPRRQRATVGEGLLKQQKLYLKTTQQKWQWSHILKNGFSVSFLHLNNKYIKPKDVLNSIWINLCELIKCDDNKGLANYIKNKKIHL